MSSAQQRPVGVFVGLATLDVVQHVERVPGPDGKATSFEHALAAGGPAANAAVAFAALGGSATLVTALGPDDAAQLVRADLEAHGVRLVALHLEATPVSSITVSSAGRSVVGSDAAAHSRQVEPPPGLLEGLVAGADVVLLDGHHPALVRAAASAARADGVPIVLDVGRWKSVFADLVPLADHAVCSQDVRAPGTGTGAADDSARELLALGARAVVVTGGAGPVLSWASRDGDVVATAVPAVEAIDTLGAGDAFHGAYAFAVASGADVAGAVRCGIDVAATRVQHRGPRGWLEHLAAPVAGALATPGAGALAATAVAGLRNRLAVPAESSRSAGASLSGTLQNPLGDGSGKGAELSGVTSPTATSPSATTPSATTSTPTTLEDLIARARALAAGASATSGRVILGIAGAPGAGKSHLAAALAEALGPALAVVVPMDGFHLGDALLRSWGRRDRKGAPDTFDADGYLALLRRIHEQRPGDPPVLAPRFDRELEDAVAGSIPVPAQVPLVITEGNYLLLPDAPWSGVRELLTASWYLAPSEELRLDRLVARHVAHGKEPAAALAWSRGPDQRNALLIEASAARADHCWELRDGAAPVA